VGVPKPFPVKPVLVFAGVIAAIRLSLALPSPFLFSPSLLAAALFLYAPLPRYRRGGFPAWARPTDPGRSVAFFALLACAGAVAFFLFVRLPLPPAISPHHGTRRRGGNRWSPSPCFSPSATSRSPRPRSA
jgi:hypothetical protein